MNSKDEVIICCLLMGYPTKDISSAIGLTTNTVNTYRKRIKQIIGSRGTVAKVKMVTLWMRS